MYKCTSLNNNINLMRIPIRPGSCAAVVPCSCKHTGSSLIAWQRPFSYLKAGSWYIFTSTHHRLQHRLSPSRLLSPSWFPRNQARPRQRRTSRPSSVPRRTRRRSSIPRLRRASRRVPLTRSGLSTNDNTLTGQWKINLCVMRRWLHLRMRLMWISPHRRRMRTSWRSASATRRILMVMLIEG